MSVTATVANCTVFVGMDTDAVPGPPSAAYGPGDSITLSDADYARLLACGVLVNPATQVVAVSDGSDVATGAFQVVAT